MGLTFLKEQLQVVVIVIDISELRLELELNNKEGVWDGTHVQKGKGE